MINIECDIVINCLYFIVLPFDPLMLLSFSHSSRKLFDYSNIVGGLVWKLLYKRQYLRHHSPTVSSWKKEEVMRVCFRRWFQREDIKLEEKYHQFDCVTRSFLDSPSCTLSLAAIEGLSSALLQTISCLKAKQTVVSALQRVGSSLFDTILDGGRSIYFGYCRDGDNTTNHPRKSKWSIQFYRTRSSNPIQITWRTFQNGDLGRLKMGGFTVFEVELQLNPLLPVCWSWFEHGISFALEVLLEDTEQRLEDQKTKWRNTGDALRFLIDFLQLFPFPPHPTICYHVRLLETTAREEVLY